MTRSLKIPATGVEQFIRDLARQHNVAYVQTPMDKLATVLTELSGDDVEQDDVCDLIRALERAGIVKKEEWLDLLHAYLTEKHKPEQESQDDIPHQ